MTNTNSLIIEFLSEELPPIKLEDNIGNPFAQSIYEQLQGFLHSDNKLKMFVAPRRFGCVINGIDYQQKDQQVVRKGPAIATALKDGAPTPALMGFAKSCGAEWEQLDQREDGYFYFTTTVKGKTLDNVIGDIINAALKKIHIAKAMRWGDTDYQFVRPLHSLIVMYNDKVLPCEVLGLNAGNTTDGHRFMAGAVTIDTASNYLSQMNSDGKVVAEFVARRKLIDEQLNTVANKLGLKISHIDGLLDEVTALVEWPEVLLGSFDEKFLKVPQECLILSMAKNQKYFALVDSNNKLSNKFLFVSNLISKDPQVIINGNQKVLTARLADAEFFYEFDKRTPLADFVPRSKNVVYHNKLGSQFERVERLQTIASTIAPLLGVDPMLASQTAYLLKADLGTEMVGEFPELQGIMGAYYARECGLSADIANAIEKHYYPRFSGDVLPDTPLATVVSLADKLETLVGIWGIGLIPTGDKDPYALRRAALGVVRILLVNKLDLEQLLKLTADVFADESIGTNTVDELHSFIIQRLANYLTSVEGYATKVVNAVLAASSTNLSVIVNVCNAFAKWSNDESNKDLFEANKRIENILKKNESEIDSLAVLDADLFTGYEVALFDAAKVVDINANVDVYLGQLSTLSAPLTEFFANVMVMDENLAIRKNRLKLLSDLYSKFNRYGKLSELA